MFLIFGHFLQIICQLCILVFCFLFATLIIQKNITICYIHFDIKFNLILQTKLLLLLSHQSAYGMHQQTSINLHCNEVSFKYLVHG